MITIIGGCIRRLVAISASRQEAARLELAVVPSAIAIGASGEDGSASDLTVPEVWRTIHCDAWMREMEANVALSYYSPFSTLARLFCR